MSPSLAFVGAHPDDDVYTIGGFLAGEGRGAAVTVVVATSGEQGQISDPALATPENLATVREAEEREALAVLGVAEPDLRFLGYPDGRLTEVDREELVTRIAAVLDEARPDVVVTFGPEGVTMHPDHVAIGEAATEAFHRVRGASGGERAGLRRLYHAAIPRSAVEAFWRAVGAAGTQHLRPDDPFVPRGIPDEDVAVRVEAGAVLARKLEAIRRHRTQLDELEVTPEEAQIVLLGTEHFVQAWPPRTPGPVASGLFGAPSG